MKLTLITLSLVGSFFIGQAHANQIFDEGSGDIPQACYVDAKYDINQDEPVMLRVECDSVYITEQKCALGGKDGWMPVDCSIFENQKK